MDPEVADIDLNDPELEKAATKIQATFKGYKARREKDGGSGGGSEEASAAVAAASAVEREKEADETVGRITLLPFLPPSSRRLSLEREQEILRWREDAKAVLFY